MDILVAVFYNYFYDQFILPYLRTVNPICLVTNAPGILETNTPPNDDYLHGKPLGLP